MDIFISYSRADRDRVTHIARGLEQAGYTVWWDRHIKPGQDFGQVIEEAINAAKAVVVVWSNHSVRSNWVRDEAQFGVQHDRLVPVMIDAVNTPLGFGRIHAAELFDGEDDPTRSSQWADFLESVRTQIGEGEGRAEDESETSRDAPAGSPVTPPPYEAVTGSTATPFWKRPAAMAAAVAGVLVAGLLAFQFGPFGGPAAPPDPDDMSPVVLGIYPEEGFGKDQARGLDAAFEDMPGVTIRELKAPLDAMKGRNAPELIENLERYLDNQNVVAIVGPSITEFTPEVLDVVEASGRKPAIVLTTASTRSNIGWDDRDLPLFRVGSGIDERAAQFARLARNTISGGSELVLLFEEVPNSSEMTYGQIFFQRIAGNLPEWEEWSDRGKIRSIRYTRGSIADSFEAPRRRALLDQNKMIVVVGLSTDFGDLVRAFYKAEDAPRAALLGGWNTSKSLHGITQGTENREAGTRTEPVAIQHWRLFDMTDVYRSPAGSSGHADLRRFEGEFGVLSPALRQEAVAYDSGLVVKQAIRQIGEGEIRAEAVVGILRGRTFEGVTGQIRFAEGGQNDGPTGGLSRALYSLQFNPDSEERWSEIRRFDALLSEAAVSSAVATR
ncbi:MAG: TIR domain-containing protein [Erythrobacter sp.]